MEGASTQEDFPIQCLQMPAASWECCLSIWSLGLVSSLAGPAPIHLFIHFSTN
jgi:hypothetical protein